jgi:hypothetical protein
MPARAQASCWRSNAREGAPRTMNNIFLNAAACMPDFLKYQPVSQKKSEQKF